MSHLSMLMVADRGRTLPWSSSYAMAGEGQGSDCTIFTRRASRCGSSCHAFRGRGECKVKQTECRGISNNRNYACSNATCVHCDQDPGGRLPLSFPKTEDQSWLKTPAQYPGVTGPWAKGAKGTVATYSEGLSIGDHPPVSQPISRFAELSLVSPYGLR